MMDTYAGIRVFIKDAQQQARTIRDVQGPWIRPKVPNKKHGRKGTRRAWKRRNPPHYVYHYREPDDVIEFGSTFTMTPQQADWLKRATILK